jgi:Eisosome component PIL1
MSHFSSSLASFANHIAHIRECLKAVRTREEALDETHRRRKTLLSKADTAEKKLNKMNPDHKNLRQQTDTLLSLREQIRSMDVEIMDEEASLSDWKRVKAQEWMAVLFGGLLECSEKGYVVATIGRSIISYVPLDKTEPGLARAPYSGHLQVQHLLVEAERELHKITFIGEVRPDAEIKHVGNEQDSSSPVYRLGDVAGVPSFSPTTAARDQDYTQPPSSGPYPNVNNTDEFGAYGEPRKSYSLGPGQSERNLPPDNIAGRLSEKSDGTGINPANGKFSTAPAKTSSRIPDADSSPGPREGPSQGSDFTGSSFSTKDRNPQPITDASEQSFSSSVVAALGTDWNTDGNTPHVDGFSPRSYYRQTRESRPPSYAPAARPLPGAASPVTPGNSSIEINRPISHRSEAPKNDHEGHDELGLAYMSQDDHEDVDGGRKSHEDRRVRFGSIRDVDTELQKRKETAERSHNEEGWFTCANTFRSVF